MRTRLAASVMFGLSVVGCDRSADRLPEPAPPRSWKGTDAGFTIKPRPGCSDAVLAALRDPDPNAIARVASQGGAFTCGTAYVPLALDEAVQDDAPIRVRALLEAGADPNARWSSYGDRLPLQEVIEAGLYGAPATNRAEIVRLLLDHGADPNGRWCPFESRRRDADKDGCTSIGGVTPLIMAAARDQADTTYLLLDAGADPRLEDGSGANALDSAWGEAVFQLLLPVLFPDSATREADALKYLTDRWVPGGAVGPWNQTALGRVILGSRPRTHQPHRTRRVGLLLDIGADPNQRTSSAVDWTPLAMAITAG